MIVKPKKISRKLKRNEIRVINIDGQAINELLWEHLMANKKLYFDMDSADENLICHMAWDKDEDMLTYAVCPIQHMLEGKALDFNALRKEAGITTDSLFHSHRYRTLPLTDSLFLND